MLLDANVLLYAVDVESPHHQKAAAWLDGVFAGERRLAIPWQTVGAFLRIATHPRLFERPLTAEQAWRDVEQWLDAPQVWIPEAGERTARILGDLLVRLGVTGNLLTDAQLVALAMEHGIPVVSADSDFARFPEVAWINPIA